MAMNFSKMEEEILEFWEKNKIFEKTLAKKAPKGDFVFFEGPPTANGKPGLHHVEARAFKDIICRYKTMQGYFVGRKAGWDTHGLPVELQVEKELKISGKPEIEKYGVEAFNQKCKESVWHYKEEWEKLTKRIAFWLDLEHPYVTYDNSYIESLWWIIKQIWDKGLLYQGHKVVPQCPRCGTALSSHEVALGYKNIEENSVYIKFKLKPNQKIGDFAIDDNTHILSWTTTPWTLPGNVALAVGKGIKYVKVKSQMSKVKTTIQNSKVEDVEESFILAKDRLQDVLGGEDEYKIEGEFNGSDLINLEYEPLFPGYLEAGNKKAWYVAAADFVSTEDGTGVVHTAVMYGEDDYNLGEKIGLPKVHTVDENGLFLPSVKKWAGKFAKTVEPEIVEDLKERGLLFKVLPYKHDYPFCWRCGTPLLYYAKKSWFIKMSDEKIKKQLLENNQAINWVPDYIKEGRFGEWLREVKDWALSRERYWGTPLPVWQCSCGEVKVIGSVEELEKLSDQDLKKLDLHRPFVDEIIFPCEKCKKKMRRIPEVADCWFDSGSMPFAQWHYPFENKEKIDQGKQFPAEFISEAIDQTRGWFYTLLAISTLLGHGTPYKNVICLGHLRDAKGEKMSKSKGNVVDPWDVINQYGADAARWFFYTINQPGDPKNFDMREVDAGVKKFFLIIFNVLNFYQTHVIESQKSPPKADAPRAQKVENILDKWIVAKLNLLVKDTTAKFNNYDVVSSARGLGDFVNDLSTWWLRRSRERFKGEENKKQPALETLHFTLLTLSRLIAPFTPFIAEKIYQEVGGEKESVHLENWPESDEKLLDEKVLREMEVARKIVEMVHALRAEAGIKVRQPLSLLQIKGAQINSELLTIILDEVNVKKGELAEQLEQKDGYVIKSEGAFGVGLCVALDEELKKEGLLRELTRQINGLRKEAGLKITDQVDVLLFTDDELIKAVVKDQGGELKKSVVGKSVKLVKAKTEAKWQGEFEIDDAKLWVGLNL